MATRPNQPLTTISDIGQLQKALEASGLPKEYYKTVSLNQLLLDLTNSRYIISPQFYRQLQDLMLAIEQQKGIPVSTLTQQPEALPAVQDVLAPIEQREFGTTGAEGGGGGGGGRGGGGGGGSGGGGSAMSAQEELDLYRQRAEIDAQIAEREAQQKQAYEAEQARIQREFEAQQAEIERQARLRLQRLGDLTNLVGQFAGFQARARETLAGLQGDPFAFAAARTGAANLGQTPMQGFRGQLSQYAGQPLPTVDPNAPLNAIEAQIQGLQGLGQGPQQPNIFGMAGGGMVQTMQPQTVLVGERGPEVVHGSDFQVLPLTGSGATGYDATSLLPALAPLYKGLGAIGQGGLYGVIGTGGMGQTPGFATSAGADIGKLGFNPRLLRNANTGATYYRNNAGQLQWIPDWQSFQNFGFNPGDILTVTPEQLGRLGRLPSQGTMMGDIGTGGIRSSTLTQKPMEEGPMGPNGLPAAFNPLSAPIIEPVTGAILPAPFRAAATLQHLKLTNPAFYALAISAYSNALSRVGDPNSRIGYNQGSIEAEIAQALPTGASHGLIGLR